MSTYPPSLSLSFSLSLSCSLVDCHLAVHCHLLFHRSSPFFYLYFVQSCLRALTLSRPLRPSPESVLVAAAKAPIRAILALCFLMMHLTCQLNQITDSISYFPSFCPSSAAFSKFLFLNPRKPSADQVIIIGMKLSCSLLVKARLTLRSIPVSYAGQ